MTTGEAGRTLFGSLALALGSTANTILGLVLFIFLARLISQVEMGVYASLLLVMSLFQAIGPLGLQIAAARFIPKALGERRRDHVSKYVTSILVVSSISALVSSAGLFFLAAPFSLFLTKSADNSSLFALASLAVFLNTLNVNLDAVMQGFQSFGKLAAVRVSAQLLRVAISILLLLNGYALTSIVWGFVATNACSVLLFLYFVREYIGRTPERTATAALLKYSGPILLSNITSFLSAQSDLLVLLVLTVPVFAGIYNVALTVAGLLGLILITPLSAAVQPAAAKLFGSSGNRALESALKRTSRYLAFAHVPAAVGLAALGGTAVNIMAGRSYLDAAVPLSIVAIAMIASGLCIIPIIALQTVGDTRSVLGLTLSSVAVGLAVDTALIPRFAVTGAAIGRAALMVSALIAGLYLARKRLNLSYDLQALGKSSVASAIMGVVLAMMQARLGYAPQNALLYVPTGIAIFLAIMRIQHAIRPEDIDLLLRILPTRFRSVSKLVLWIAG